jgi:hypothetical protein
MWYSFVRGISMPIAAAVALTLLISSSPASAQTAPPPREVTLTAPDGTTLGATY